MKVASILILLNFVRSRASVSLGGSATRRGGTDELLRWDDDWGVALEVPNLIREGSGQDDRDMEEASGDGTGVDDEDLLGEFETSADGVAPHSSSTSPPMESGRGKQERRKDGEVADWSDDYDSDYYIDLDHTINDDKVKTPLPKFITESQLVLVTEGSEIVLDCQVDPGLTRLWNLFMLQVDLLGDFKITWSHSGKFLAVGDAAMDPRVIKFHLKGNLKGK